MGLLLYPIFVVIGVTFYFAVAVCALMLYALIYVAILVATLIAMLLRSAWRPRHPGLPKVLGGRAKPSPPGTSSSAWAASEAVPQSRYSNRR